MNPGRGSMRRGRDPSLEIEAMTKEGEKTHKEEVIQIQERDPDTIGMIGHSQGIDLIQETIEEEVLPEIKTGEILEMRRTNPGREARKYSRGVLLADVKTA